MRIGDFFVYIFPFEVMEIEQFCAAGDEVVENLPTSLVDFCTDMMSLGNLVIATERTDAEVLH